MISRIGLRGLVVVAALMAPQGSWAQQAAPSWTASWGASPVFDVGPELSNTTVRQFVRLSAGGSQVRIRFSNETGRAPLVIGAASLARPGNAAGSIDAGSALPLTFAGQSTVSVPPGAPMLSDPVDLAVEPLATLAVTMHVARWTGPSVIHLDAVQTAYMVEGNHVSDAEFTTPKTALQRFYLSGVEVSSPGRAAPTLVTFGDSITDGYHSTVDANRRWPDRLAERLSQRGAGRDVGIVNAGISGNRVLHDRPEEMFGPSALARLDRDALAQPGLRWLVVMEGINDIGHPTSAGLTEQAVSADQIIAGHRQIIARAKAKGIKVYGATLTPFEGTIFPGYFTPEGETKRQAVNVWIRTGGAYDAVIDFDAVLRDPANPARMKAEFDEGDHLHPNDAGYRAMADSIDLALFD
ncbi:SGNH/GDSL hydrolase family protein [Aureimonas sp. AU12]|uniref:SGNH/GDSL hydrolase family protein n=1 Tax=Aureimonas sp. AU12 TaxID=1638161 RepID=UPI000782EA85|nr:SGNH/GDSL hydrolase family protein [Aureimonas sp. AU12]